jgi:copper resistance protein B
MNGWVGRWVAAAYAVFSAGILFYGPARAQTNDARGAAPFGMPVEDERAFVHGSLNELEGRFGGASPTFRWDGEGWFGTDSDRLWVKSEGSVTNGVIEGGDHQMLYDRPFSPFWDLQAGLRYDIDSFTSRGWAAMGVEGLAPQFFEVSATLYASEAGHFAARAEANYEELITQRLILEPRVELNVYTKPDVARDVASGLSDLEAGMRLRYEIRRKLGPYAGVVYERIYGPAASRTGSGPEITAKGRTGDWRFALGMRAWF